MYFVFVFIPVFGMKKFSECLRGGRATALLGRALLHCINKKISGSSFSLISQPFLAPYGPKNVIFYALSF